MDILLLGGTGQLGLEVRALPAAPGIRIVAPTRAELNIASPGDVATWVASARWSAVLNAAAYTEVDRAESEHAAAYELNAAAPARLAAETNRFGIPLIHISTDYVFDGAKGSPYVAQDRVNPLNVYGASKEAGERDVRANNPRHVILRTSWLYSPYRKNFMRTVLRLAEQRDRLTIVDDQRGCPTPAHDLAQACMTILRAVANNPERAPYGIYHFTGTGDTTWCGFARAIIEIARPHLPKVPPVEGIPTRDYPTPARRPADARLDCRSTVETWGVVQRDWRAGLEETLSRHFAEEIA